VSAVEPGAERPDRSAVSAEHPTQAMVPVVPVVPVVLVGGGPGDPDLLTLRAARELATPTWSSRCPVGDGVLARSRRHRTHRRRQRPPATPQEMISGLLVTCPAGTLVGTEGRRSFVFDAGEALELQRRHSVEVVPRISSSVAAPATRGIR
jgi:siroheme synthase